MKVQEHVLRLPQSLTEMYPRKFQEEGWTYASEQRIHRSECNPKGNISKEFQGWVAGRSEVASRIFRGQLPFHP